MVTGGSEFSLQHLSACLRVSVRPSNHASICFACVRLSVCPSLSVCQSGSGPLPSKVIVTVHVDSNERLVEDGVVDFRRIALKRKHRRRREVATANMSKVRENAPPHVLRHAL